MRSKISCLFLTLMMSVPLAVAAQNEIRISFIKGQREADGENVREGSEIELKDVVRLNSGVEDSIGAAVFEQRIKFHLTQPEESFLLIGDGRLTVADIENEDNIFDGVDLLAPSACDTAMTNNGMESESLAYLAQDFGARTVLASLWPVSDSGTPTLITRFYTIRRNDPTTTKGQALLRAQLLLLLGETIADTPRAVTKMKSGATKDVANRAENLGVTRPDPNFRSTLPKKVNPLHIYFIGPLSF